ncbi:MAG: hypothetical protein AABY32_03990 [Nanoarchaeota archaeon]
MSKYKCKRCENHFEATQFREFCALCRVELDDKRNNPRIPKKELKIKKKALRDIEESNFFIGE